MDKQVGLEPTDLVILRHKDLWVLWTMEITEKNKGKIETEIESEEVKVIEAKMRTCRT